jgi:hypothetical protein
VINCTLGDYLNVYEVKGPYDVCCVPILNAFSYKRKRICLVYQEIEVEDMK